MDVLQLRLDFAKFLGDEKYGKFIKTVCNQYRLLFWQESAWAKFVELQPNHCSLSAEEVRDSFRSCEVHREELRLDWAETTLVHYDFTADSVKAMVRLFPHASRGPFTVREIPPPDGRVQVWYCEECRKANSIWMDQNA